MKSQALVAVLGATAILAIPVLAPDLSGGGRTPTPPTLVAVTLTVAAVAAAAGAVVVVTVAMPRPGVVAATEAAAAMAALPPVPAVPRAPMAVGVAAVVQAPPQLVERVVTVPRAAQVAQAVPEGSVVPAALQPRSQRRLQHPECGARLGLRRTMFGEQNRHVFQ